MSSRLHLFAACAGIVIGASMAVAQTPGSTYDVVSIRPVPAGASFGPTPNSQRPDGGFTMTNTVASTLIARAYGIAPIDMVGLPDWSRTQRFDVSATSTLTIATPEQQAAMMRAMLADRFKLLAHVEKRPRDVYELVMARDDRRLGPGITPIDADCVAVRAAATAARGGAPPPPPPITTVPSQTPGERPRIVFNTPPAPCTVRSASDVVEGQGAIADVLVLFRVASGREVIDNTGLKGFYQFSMRFDQAAGSRPPGAAPVSLDAAPTIFTAVQEQLGMKLQSARVERDALVIDRLERPTEN